jgi:hypothetical protein
VLGRLVLLDLLRRGHLAVVFVRHAFLEALDALAEVTHHFGNPATTEQDQNNQRQYDQVR